MQFLLFSIELRYALFPTVFCLCFAFFGFAPSSSLTFLERFSNCRLCFLKFIHIVVDVPMILRSIFVLGMLNVIWGICGFRGTVCCLSALQYPLDCYVDSFGFHVWCLSVSIDSLLFCDCFSFDLDL